MIRRTRRERLFSRQITHKTNKYITTSESVERKLLESHQYVEALFYEIILQWLISRIVVQLIVIVSESLFQLEYVTLIFSYLLAFLCIRFMQINSCEFTPLSKSPMLKSIFIFQMMINRKDIMNTARYEISFFLIWLLQSAWCLLFNLPA